MEEPKAKILTQEYKNIFVLFWLKKDMNGEWRKLHNEEVHSLYHLPNVVRIVKSKRLWDFVARKEEDRSAFKILTGKPIGERPLG